MKRSHLAMILVGAIAVLPLSGCQTIREILSPPSGTNPTIKTVFICQQQNGEPVTNAQQGNKKSKAPLFSWNSRFFGTEWSPLKRCNEVTDRLNEAVDKNNGLLSNVLLATGEVNKLKVICALSKGEETCHGNNVLVTLNPDNARHPGAVLERISRWNGGKSTDSTTKESDPQISVVSLENIMKQAEFEESF